MTVRQKTNSTSHVNIFELTRSGHITFLNPVNWSSTGTSRLVKPDLRHSSHPPITKNHTVLDQTTKIFT